MSNTPRKRAPTRKAAPQQSQRERLMGRRRPSMPYRILVDPDGAQASRQELERVQAETRQTRMREKPGSAALKQAEKRLGDAEAAVDSCYEEVTLTAVEPARLEELEAECPPTKEQLAKAREAREAAKKRGDEPEPWPQYDETRFYPALLAECAPDAGMSVDDWAQFLAEHVSDGERRGLWLAALEINRQERAVDPLVLPKGWMPTLS